MCLECSSEPPYPVGIAQATLLASTSADPYEKEADRNADAVVNRAGYSPASSTPLPSSSRNVSVQRLCSQCHAASKGSLPNRHEPAPGANAAKGAASLGAQPAMCPGWPLTKDSQEFFGSRLGRDFARVRVHDDARSNDMAQSVGAKAFTLGNDIVFNRGQYQPHSLQGERLLVHELTHVAQQTSHRGYLGIQRAPLDPANEYAWSFLSPRHRRSGWLNDTYEETLGAAAGASMDLQTEVQETGAPRTDEDKEVFAARMRRLVRLNALGLMASHRSTIESKQRDAIRSFEGRTAPENAFDTEVPGRERFLQRIRDTGAKVHQLQQVREELEGYRGSLDALSGQVLIGQHWGSISDVYNRIVEYSEPYKSPAIRRYFRQQAHGVFGQPRTEDELRLFAHVISGYLARWRQRQISGIDLTLVELYEAFPIFSELDAEDFQEGEYADDDALEQAARDAYLAVIEDIDEAIVNIGSGDTHPFDLPEAVSATRAGLPESLHAAFDEVIQDHEASEFWWSLGWTLAQIALVFIPVVGPALAAGAGLIDLAMQVEEVMDRYALSDAATNPEGELLGVRGPGTLDWVLLGVTAILTAADLGMLAREFRAARGAMALESMGLADDAIGELDSLLRAQNLDPSDVGALGHINPETLAMFRRNPRLLGTYSDNPLAARLLKHCQSPCFPDGIADWQIQYLDDFLSELAASGRSLEDIGVNPEALRQGLANAGSDAAAMDILNSLERRLETADEFLAADAMGGVRRGPAEQGLRATDDSAGSAGNISDAAHRDLALPENYDALRSGHPPVIGHPPPAEPPPGYFYRYDRSIDPPRLTQIVRQDGETGRLAALTLDENGKVVFASGRRPTPDVRSTRASMVDREGAALAADAEVVVPGIGGSEPTTLSVVDAMEARRDALSRRDALLASGDRRGAGRAQAEANRYTEAIGDRAAVSYMETAHPGATRILQGRGPNTFDQVWDNPSPPPDFFIVEAKGGQASNTSSRVGSGGLRYQQGTTGYVDSIVSEMYTSSDPQVRRLARRLQRSLSAEDGVRYLEVSQPFSDVSTLGDIRVRDYSI
jgi:hypothetical protein